MQNNLLLINIGDHILMKSPMDLKGDSDDLLLPSSTLATHVPLISLSN